MERQMKLQSLKASLVQEGIGTPKVHKTKRRGAGVKTVSRCFDDCYASEETDCAVLHSDTFRCFAGFQQPPVGSTEVSGMKSSFYFPPEEPTLVDQVKEDLLTRLFTRWLHVYHLEGHHVPFTLSQLPTRPVTASGSIISGHVVSVRSPSDFHMILEDERCYGESLWISRWTSHYLRSLRKFETEEIQTPIHMLRNVSVLLAQYASFMFNEIRGDSQTNSTKFQSQDLVIVIVPRKMGMSTSFFAYRGVILKRFHPKTGSTSVSQDLFIVYLLDTGERRIVDTRWLLTLPKPFVKIPPLGIRCSLHGISPVCSDWSSEACSEMRHVVSPGQVKLHALFYSEPRNLEPSKKSLLAELDAAYVVELVKVSGTETGQQPLLSTEHAVNSLVDKGLAVEWSLVPQRPLLRVPPPKSDKQEEQVDSLMSRNEALFFCEGPLTRIRRLPDPVLLLEMERIFQLRSRVVCASFTHGFTNILCMKLDDPEENLSDKCVPFL